MESSVDKLKPNDPRVQYKSAILNGKTYGYILGEPQSSAGRSIPKKGTIFLLHGFPDMSFGWRYQIPMLMDMGFKVVAPDFVGYGRTDAPAFTIKDYTFKSIAEDFKQLAEQLGENKIVVAGHDWGAAVTYKLALYCPDLITHIITVCVPYDPPKLTLIPLPIVVRTILPNFAYQLQLASGNLETKLTTPLQVRSFLAASYGGRSKSTGRPGWNAKGEIDIEGIAKGDFAAPLTRPKTAIESSSSSSSLDEKTTYLVDEEELDHYVQEYLYHSTFRTVSSSAATTTSSSSSSSSSSMSGTPFSPLRGATNWYRTRTLNYMDDLDHLFAESPVLPPHPRDSSAAAPAPVPLKIFQPTLFIGATRDIALPPAMYKRMFEHPERSFEKSCIIKEVETGHWALWEGEGKEVNAIFREWIEENVFGRDADENGAKSRL